MFKENCGFPSDGLYCIRNSGTKTSKVDTHKRIYKQTRTHKRIPVQTHTHCHHHSDMTTSREIFIRVMSLSHLDVGGMNPVVVL